MRRPSTRGASARRIVSTSGSSGTAPRIGAAGLARSERSCVPRAARRPRRRPRTTPARSRRRPPSGRRGARPAAPARQASSGTCSRVWSLWPIARSTPWSAVRISRSPSRRRSHPAADRGVDLAQRADGSPRRPCGARRPGRSRRGSRRRSPRRARRSARRSPPAPAAFDAPGCETSNPRPANRSATLPTPCTVDARVVRELQVRAHGRRQREVAPARRSARTRRAAPSNGRAITRPTANGPSSAARARSHAAYRSGSLSTSPCAASWTTESTDV